MRRFVRNMEGSITLVLIAGDIDYSSELYEFRYQERVKVVLVYQETPHYSLLEGVNESYSLKEFCENLPRIRRSKMEYPVFLKVFPLPDLSKPDLVKLLETAFSNVGGKIRQIETSEAVIKVANSNLAKRAIKRVNGQTIGGITVQVVSAQCNPTDRAPDNTAAASTSGNVQENAPDENAPELALHQRQTSATIENTGSKTTPAIFDVNQEVEFGSVLEETSTNSKRETEESQEKVKRKLEEGIGKESNKSKRGREN